MAISGDFKILSLKTGNLFQNISFPKYFSENDENSRKKEHAGPTEPLPDLPLAGFTLSPEPVSERAAGFTPGPEPVHERAAGFTREPNQYAKALLVSHLALWTWTHAAACNQSFICMLPRDAQDDAWHQKNPSSSSSSDAAAAAALNLRNTLPKSEL